MNEIYEDELNPVGLRYNETTGLNYSQNRGKKPPSAARAAFNQSNASNWGSPVFSKLSDLVGPSDYGNSTYDSEIQNINQLDDLEDTRANIQPFIHKLGAGIGTFAGKTATATIGGLGTLFYGVPNAIAEGRFSAIFDNDFNKSLEKINEGIDDTFKVYASEAERNGSFWDQTLGSSHWWTKSLLGDGMSFTAGAILSAYALGGVGGILGKAANSMKLSSAAFTGAEGIGALRTAINVDKAIGGATKAAGLITRNAVGSMYEGGVEANDFIKQSIDRYKQQVYEQTGEIPTDDQLDDYKLSILPTANALFAANVALVSASNVAVLPSVFGKGVNESIRTARKNIVLQTVDDVIKPVLKDETLTGIEKATKLAWRAAKPLASEGLMEEGGQNFAKNMALDYVDKHYNPDSAKNTYDIMNSLGNAFNQAYGTIDGWKEIMAGMVIGGFGSPNLSRIGKFEKTEDGKTKWNPLSLDSDKSWWTGGVIGEFQDHRENNMRAKEIIDDYNAQDRESAMEYFKQNRSMNQGIAGQISDINHQNSLSAVMDDAVVKGDFFTAKNAEQDRFHSYVKSRVDAGYYDTIEAEIIDPIKEMSEDEFAEAFGYKNMSKQELSDRKSKTIKEAQQSIKDTVDAINYVDSRLSFDLGTEEGRLRRNLNIYSIATSKAIGNRIEQLSQIIRDAAMGRVNHEHDDKYFDMLESVPQSKIKELEASKEGKTEEEVARINETINKHQTLYDELNAQRRASKETARMSKEGLDIPTMAIPAKNFAKGVLSLYQPKDGTVEELELKEKLESALEDLPKLLRRKEEAIELYAVAKDPKAFNNMFKTERVQEWIEKQINKAAENIANVQNKEHAEAEAILNEDENIPPEVVAQKTGAAKSTIQAIVNNKHKLKEARKAQSIKNLLSAINKDLIHEDKYESAEELVDSLLDIIDDSNATEAEIADAKAMIAHIEKIIGEAVKPKVKTPDAPPSKDGLIDDGVTRDPSDITDINENINSADEANKDLKSNDKMTSNDSDGDMLIDAFNHIA